MVRRVLSSLALSFAAPACFADHVPTGGAATTGTSQSSSGAASSGAGATTGPAGTTAGTLTVGTTAEATSTIGQGSSGTTEPTGGTTTTTTTTTTGVASSTSGDAGTSGGSSGGPLSCADEATRYACYVCCADQNPGVQVYYDKAAGCLCPDGTLCGLTCAGSLCLGDNPSQGCFACAGVQLGTQCMLDASNACKQAPECNAYLKCVNESGCPNKPI